MLQRRLCEWRARSYGKAVSVQLRQMSSDEVSAWLPTTMDHYVAERVLSGEEPDVAQRQATKQLEQIAPGGVPTPDHHFFWLVDGSDEVGALWLGAPSDLARATWFVYFVVVHNEFRERGYGRDAMLAAEQWSKEHDGHYLALNVFGHNHVARNLYDSLGFAPMATLMRKALS